MSKLLILGGHSLLKRWNIARTTATAAFRKNRLFCGNSIVLQGCVTQPQLLQSSFFSTSCIVCYNNKMVHPLDDSSVESFFIPGAKVFDRYFDCPLGKYMHIMLRVFFYLAY
jgi:hypothetical protein